MHCTAADGRIFRAEWEGQFDPVLVDAPCSGLGIIRKKPDIRYKKAGRSFRHAGDPAGHFGQRRPLCASGRDVGLFHLYYSAGGE
ncbi:MAG: hypothetical protein V8R40_08325 [Dysosmobacter sp.]